jgi:hypothetical protein
MIIFKIVVQTAKEETKDGKPYGKADDVVTKSVVQFPVDKLRVLL